MKYNYMKDYKWHRSQIEEGEMFKPHCIEKSLLGSGYSESCLPSDGFGELKPVIMMLEKETDYIGGLVWVWYNK